MKSLQKASDSQVPQQISVQKSFISQIRTLMTYNQPKCIGTKLGVYICINKKCKKRNPLVCVNQKCQCSQLHELCPQIKVRSFNKVFERKDKILNAVQQKLNEKTNKLIDRISDLRQNIITKLRNGRQQDILQDYIENKWWKQHQNNNKYTNNNNKDHNKSNNNNGCQKQNKQYLLDQKSITGQLISSIWYSDQKIDEQKRHEIIAKTIQQTFEKYQQLINNQFNKMFKIVLKPHIQINKFYWNHQLKGASQLINYKTVKKNGSQSDRFTLLQPSISKIKAHNIKWEIHVIKVCGWVGLGICFKNIVQQNKYDFINYTQSQHGSYIISSNGYTWSHQNPSFNSTTGQGIQIKSDNIISFQLDLIQKKFKYNNKSLCKSGQIPIPEKCLIQAYGDELHICSCLGSVGDQIQLIGNIIVDGIQIGWDDKKK